MRRKRPHLYVPKALATIIWFTSRNSTCIQFGEHHICQEHNAKVTVEHLRECSLTKNVGAIQSTLNRITQQNIRDWDEGDLTQAMLTFTKLHLTITWLENSGQYKKSKLIPDRQAPK